ncbi:MAG: MtnX-like HAD-IB family phosphatase [Firmicutes bacterium]|jgi:2-hydroxy-3-keto-5-methylthiopentenyl-1-phosphate phosphatase|nr:MtnX-like HAD-IB family phosphatase [Bacillota bacterium]
MSKLAPPCELDVWVLCDFDGTASVRDVQNMLLDHFLGQGWRKEVQAALAEGKKSSAYMPRIYADWPATREEMIRAIDEKAELDPYLVEFVEYCRKQQYHLEIVSDGLDIYINHLLGKHQLDYIPYTSNRLVFADGKARLESPFRSGFCGLCGNCKKQRVLAARKANADCVVYIGDGISDECPAAISDIVFAKNQLLAYCQEHDLPAIPFENFSEVLEAFPEALENYQKMQDRIARG